MKHLIGHCFGNYGDVSYTLIIEVEDEEDGNSIGKKLDEIIEEENNKTMDDEIKALLRARKLDSYVLDAGLHSVKENDGDLFSFTEFFCWAII